MSANTSFSPTPAEQALVQQIFAVADPQKLGIITGEVAVKVFGGAKIPPTVLGEIWSIADDENNGFLSRKGVCIAVRLMGWAQKGEKVNRSLVNKPGPVPHIDGVSPGPLKPQTTGVSLPKSPPPPTLQPLSQQDKAKFLRIFANAGPSNGLLSSEKARDVFVKSKLPVEKLSQIWNLADTQDRGALDAADFIVGMYLIQATMAGTLTFIPTSLPPGLYELAGGTGKSAASPFVGTHVTGGSQSTFSPNPSTFSPNARSALLPQYTGGQKLQQDLTGSAPITNTSSPRPPQLTGGAFGNGSALGGAFGGVGRVPAPAWDITAAEKANADRIFDGLDSQKKGYIEGDVAVPFMLESKLPGDDLAQVWDLADVNNDGRLTRDGFAVAMHLIQGKLAGKPIPASLPPSLVPPSMRSPPPAGGNSFQAQQDAGHHFDLLGDDSPPASAIPTISTQQTGGPSLPPRIPPQLPPRDPFGGSSAFGSASSNFLDDDDAGSSAPHVQDKSAEIGNLRNQVNSTNQSLDKTKTERASVERMLADQAGQLSALQTQLASAKAAYETETKLLSTLRDRFSTQTAEIQKTREELIRAESDLSAVRVEKAEVEGAFLRDKEESRELHKKMVAAGQQVEIFKAEVEKAKKEAKQQKGLLAIAKKQLSTKEAERLKAEKEVEEAAAEAAQATKEREEAEGDLAKLEQQAVTVAASPAPSFNKSPERAPSRADSLMFAASQALPMSAGTSPTPSILSPQMTGKSNNPFERLALGNSTPRSGSPLASVRQMSPPPQETGNSPSSKQATIEEDVFGFEQAFEAESKAEEPAQRESWNLWNPTPEATGVTTPKAVRTNMTGTSDSARSPGGESDVYSTPPSTAIGLSHSAGPSPIPPKSHSTMDDVKAKFPDLDTDVELPGTFPFGEEPTPSQEKGKEKELSTDETDLGAQLKELDVEESDSDDSDSDEDEVPLAQLAHEKKQSVDEGEPQGGASVGNTNRDVPASKPSFDDIFGAPMPSTQNGAAKDVSDDASPFGLSSPPAHQDVFASAAVSGPSAAATLPETKPAVAGVNAFDEAMGRLPSSPSSNVPQFSFDSAFDDNFDFSKASEASAFPPPPAPSQPQSPLKSNGAMNGSSFGNSPAPQTNVDSQERPSFDDVFSVKPAKKATPASVPPAFTQTALPPVPAPAPAPQAFASPPAPEGQGLSFDEAFATEPRGLSLESSFASIDTAQTRTSAGSRTTNASPPSSPTSRIPSVTTTVAPPTNRAKSPPPRPGKEAKEDKLKEPPTSRSKLSIRLPFGKKKHKEPTPDRASQFLAPPIEEESARIPTPGADDDVEPVKVLCGMGFSRAQVVEALEKHGYDTQKALNMLLGQA